MFVPGFFLQWSLLECGSTNERNRKMGIPFFNTSAENYFIKFTFI